MAEPQAEKTRIEARLPVNSYLEETSVPFFCLYRFAILLRRYSEEFFHMRNEFI
jgi:hypothetical protein